LEACFTLRPLFTGGTLGPLFGGALEVRVALKYPFIDGFVLEVRLLGSVRLGPEIRQAGQACQHCRACRIQAAYGIGGTGQRPGHKPGHRKAGEYDVLVGSIAHPCILGKKRRLILVINGNIKVYMIIH
jgi:hypothetical protein